MPGLTGAVYQLCVLGAGLYKRANICAADVALIDSKESLSRFKVILPQKPLQVLEAVWWMQVKPFFSALFKSLRVTCVY